jgi:hypothetical protein
MMPKARQLVAQPFHLARFARSLPAFKGDEHTPAIDRPGVFHHLLGFAHLHVCALRRFIVISTTNMVG